MRSKHMSCFTLACKAGEKMEMLLFIFLFILARACPVRPQQLLPQNMFILAGQSNMAGRGGVIHDNVTGVATWDGVVPPKCQPNPSILRLSANLTWVAAQEPLHAGIDVNETNGVGPGMAFANTVLLKDPTFGVIGLVPCAIGGTTINQWGRGTFLYKQLVKRAQASLRDGGTIQALLWYQGEADTLSKGDAESYQGKLRSFFEDVREDLQSPMLPIIQVALASGGPFVDIVREAQLGIDLLGLRTVDAMGLPLEPDALHLTTAAQVALASGGPFVDIVREAQLGIDLLDLRTVDAMGLPLEPDALHLTMAAEVRLGEMLADTFLKLLPSSTPIKSSAP